MPVAAHAKAARTSRTPATAPFAALARMSGALIMPVAILWIGDRLPVVTSTATGLLVILLIAAIGRKWGPREALGAAFTGSIAFHFVLLPEHGPGHWIALFAFMSASIGAGLLSTGAPPPGCVPFENREETERLYRLASAIAGGGHTETTVQQIANRVAEVFELDGVVLFDTPNGQIARAGPCGNSILAERVHEIAAEGKLGEDPISGFVFAPIRAGNEAAGWLGVRSRKCSRDLLCAIGGRVAMGLARIHAFEQSAQAEITRRCEELKSAVLDALAHEIRAPLNSIKIAVSSLAAASNESEAFAREMLTIIEEEADRMNVMIDDAVQLSHVDAGQLTLNRQPESVQLLVSGALEQIAPRAAGRAFQIRMAETLPPVECDSRLLTKALKLLLENALKYSPDGSPVTIAAECDPQALLLKVVNEGPAIPEDEHALIFERYYRGRASRRRGVPGTGLGLSSAKTIVEAHGGRIWLVSPPDGGAEFDVLLPLAQKMDLWAARAS
jgi:two-component system sensor histidine kinase KdpD